MSYIQLVQNYLYGNAYSAQPDDDITEGGYACFSKYPNGQRVWLNGVSAIINVYILYLTYSTVKCQSRECDPRLVKHVKPNLIEKICGAMSLCVLITQICYKTYQKKAIFMLNLCHQTLFLEAYLLLLPKTRKSGLVFICYMTWLCGSYMAVFFPNTTGLNMPYEIELFWLEHILICIGPMLLIYSGRYGFYKESLWMTVKKQYFGMACALIIQRFVIGPTAILTWVNLNYMICPNTMIFKNYYLYMADHYVNFTSILFQALVIPLTYLLQYCYLGLKRVLIRPFPPASQQASRGRKKDQ